MKIVSRYSYMHHIINEDPSIDPTWLPSQYLRITHHHISKAARLRSKLMFRGLSKIYSAKIRIRYSTIPELHHGAQWRNGSDKLIEYRIPYRISVDID